MDEVGLLGMNLPTAPDSVDTGSSDWNYGNMAERASLFVQPALRA